MFSKGFDNVSNVNKTIKYLLLHPIFIATLLAACGLLYICLNAVNISYASKLKFSEVSHLIPNERVTNQRVSYYKLPVHSSFHQSAIFNIVTSDEIDNIWLGNEIIHKKRDYPETRTTYQDKTYGDEYVAHLNPGENLLIFKFKKNHKNIKFTVSQKFQITDILIFSLFVLFPVAYLGSQLLSVLINNVSLWVRMKNTIPFVFYMIGFAILLRIYYFVDMGYISFQHDYQGHIEFIKFFADNFTLPLPHKGWEYPQQPLYYMLSGTVFAITRSIGLSDWHSLWSVGWITVILNAVGLVFAYRLVRLLTPNVLVQNLTMAFLCFTPSLIYMSTRISNDPFAASFSIIALFYIFSSYQHDFKKYFFTALFWCTALFMTKISAVAIELVFFILIVMKYHSLTNDMSKGVNSIDKKIMNEKIVWFAMVGLVALSFTLYRAYYPAAGQFHLVNSGIWSGQDLRPLGLSYLFSFNFLELLQAGQSLIGEKDIDAITHSFPTYQYGTMLFGEFGYEYWQKKNLFLFPLQQFIIAVAFIVPIGWIAFCFLQKKRFLDWLLILVVVVTLILIFKFIFAYPSVSNTDFRYHVASFFALALFFAYGIACLASLRPWLHKLLSVWAVIYFSSNITFILLMCLT